ncbi:MAG TPA: hypothetical protein IGS53_09330 [Leptolyngbyaceae cyanobacterium M33_DOE_097]|uniref:Uncharacterized protein n=1 Tax=Oscillatoriales cyanobacterium SpSt-418 TaxID=2282169 RepID=A0A7C3KFQ6_9CYAN|nr:hypothetical protein [Leptolyngbyaceae cyanobacterium M33_DOE_097]
MGWEPCYAGLNDILHSLQKAISKDRPLAQVVHTANFFRQTTRAIAFGNLRLTSPVPSVNEQSADLFPLNIWLANHSTSTRITLRGL